MMLVLSAIVPWAFRAEHGLLYCRDWGSTSSPFLHTPVPGLPEALLSNCFTADRYCGSCLGLDCSDLLQSYRELYLLSLMGLFPQQVGLLVKELILGG